MGCNWRRLRSAWIAGVLVLLSLGIYGCVDVDVLDTTPEVGAPEVAPSPQPSGTGEHNLAVLAVEFDPPLDYQHLIVLREQVALLVAVENTGSRTERQIGVAAELTSSEDSNLLLSQRTIVDSIAPGEVQVVRFPSLDDVPYHWDYHLEVTVDSVEGERNLGDNRKAFDIQIHRR